jgi:hypothetical protein
VTRSSGQALIIGVLLLVILLIAIPAIILINSSNTRHGVMTQQKLKGRAVADEGIALAIQKLTQVTPVNFPAQPAGVASPGAVGTMASVLMTSSTVPTVMFPSQRVPVTLEFKNMGSTPWTALNYRLGSRNGDLNTTWGVNLIPLPADVAVGSSYQFQFLAQAPSTIGTAQFQWGMYRVDTNQFFGANSPNITVSIQNLDASHMPNWPHLSGTMPPNGIVHGVEGTSFDLYYASAPSQDLQDYQVGIFSTPLDVKQQPIRAGTTFAVVSHKTVGVRLPTGVSAAAALQLQHPPTYGTSSDIDVWWGPVALFDTNSIPQTLTLSPSMDANRAPRKFATGPISVRAPDDIATPTDNKEYWAFADMGFPAPIDLAFYQKQAQDATVSPLAGAGLPASWSCSGVCQHLAGTGYFYIAPYSTLTIDNGGPTSPAWAYAPNQNAVLFFDGGQNGMRGGNVIMKNVAINVRDRGAVIVTGNFTIGERYDDKGYPLNDSPVPPTAPLEYPDNTFACVDDVGQDCATSSIWGGPPTWPSLVGFLYVMGSMDIKDHIAGQTYSNTALVGTVRVDGAFTLANRAQLLVALDTKVNHNIRTTNFDVLIDSVTVGGR